MYTDNLIQEVLEEETFRRYPDPFQAPQRQMCYRLMRAKLKERLLKVLREHEEIERMAIAFSMSGREKNAP